MNGQLFPSRGTVIVNDSIVKIKEGSKTVKYHIELLNSEGDFADYAVIDKQYKGKLTLSIYINSDLNIDRRATVCLSIETRGKNRDIIDEKIYYLEMIESRYF